MLGTVQCASVVVLLVGLCAPACQPSPYRLDGGDLAAAGAVFLARRGCAGCHQGTMGRLAGANAPLPNTSSYSSNLTPDHATGIGDWADIEIVRAIRFGLDNQGLPLCPSMPHFTDMTELESAAIVALLRSLPPVLHAVVSSRCPPLKPPVLDGSTRDGP